MIATEYIQLTAPSWMHNGDCNQGNETKQMKPSEGYQVKASKWMEPSNRMQVNETNPMQR